MKIINKKARFDYFLLGSWECGIVLKGSEVKSIRNGQVSFKDSFGRIDKGEVYIYNLHIAEYEKNTIEKQDPDRVRKLLLHKKEIKKIEREQIQKKLALIPTKIYFNKKGIAKIELSLAKGKKQYDKRESIKKREIDKTMQRRLKGN